MAVAVLPEGESRYFAHIEGGSHKPFKEEETMVSVYTFGDSMLDCGHSNALGVNPGQLVVHNDDRSSRSFTGTISPRWLVQPV